MRGFYVAISALIVAIALAGISILDRNQDVSSDSSRLRVNREQLTALRTVLRSHAEKTGSYPTTEQSLTSVWEIRNMQTRYGIRLDKPLNHTRVWRSGLLSVWGEPYIYENRRGINPAKFADSGATIDKKRAYSIKVDNGVYIWSLGGKQSYEHVKLWNVIFVAIIVLAIAAALPFIRLAVRHKPQYNDCVPPSRLLSVISYIGWGTVFTLELAFFTIVLSTIPQILVTCYRMSFEQYRSPQQTKDYLAVMTKYRDRGIISKSACNKIIKTTNRDYPVHLRDEDELK